MDKLARDSTAAIKAGMSYGKYMAMKEPVVVTPPERRGTWRTCPRCGKEFVRYDRIKATYCGVACQKSAQAARKYERRKGKAKE